MQIEKDIRISSIRRLKGKPVTSQREDEFAQSCTHFLVACISESKCKLVVIDRVLIPQYLDDLLNNTRTTIAAEALCATLARKR